MLSVFGTSLQRCENAVEKKQDLEAVKCRSEWLANRGRLGTCPPVLGFYHMYV